MQRLINILVCASVALGAEFSYNRCDNGKGPSKWEGTCQTSALQSPINLCGAQPFTSAPTVTPSGYDEQLSVMGLNNGHTIQINFAADTAPTLNMGDVAKTVGRGSNLNQTWVLAQMHLHWGRTGHFDEGSEHYLQGVRYPLEAHLVHYNQAYGSVASAVSQDDGLLVVGVFFEKTGTSNSVISNMAANVPGLTKTPKSLGVPVDLSSLSTFFVDGSASYYAYAGSLTTPGCNAVVTWIVLNGLQSVSAETLAQIKMASSEPATTTALAKFAPQEGQGNLIAKYGNFRPLQTQVRTVYFSTGSTAACGAVTEPVYQCSNAFMAQPSIWLLLLLATAWNTFS